MFTHLHLHSEYSLLDGACRISEIPAAVKKLGQKAVAITDHGVMYGAVEFYKACRAEGIKPIIGCEVYLTPNSRFDRKNETDNMRYHLVLLCKNEIGYKNLCYMVSKSFTEGFYVKPRIDMDLLESHKDGLICLSGCLAGYLPQMIMAREYEKADDFAFRMKWLFGEDNFYLELQDHGLEQQDLVNHALYDIYKRTGAKLVATNDVHYLRKKDADTQAVLMCIQTNSKISDGRSLGFEKNEYYLKSEAEMLRLFDDYPDAIINTERITEMCNFEFDFSHQYLPSFTPETGEAPSEYLRRMAYEGFEKKKSAGDIVFTEEHTEKTYIDRIESELSVIISMEYDEYYLVVADFVNHAKSMGVPTGPGRGSGAASLVAYLINITEIDPIKFNLMFERFLSPERVTMPDFDIDFCDEQRYKVINYVTEKYGSDNVCGITTFGTLAAKAAVRDVGRALGMSYSDVDAVARSIPNDIHITLKQAMAGPLGDLYRKNADVKKLIDISMAIEGMPRHASAHAAGIVIMDEPIYEYVPLSVNSDITLAQFTMNNIADLGLLKFDFLGLRYLTIISDTEDQIRETSPNFDIKKIPFDDAATYKMISLGKTDGLFQLESAGIKRLLVQMQPKNIEDIILAIALYRPGPMESIPMFTQNRANPDKIEYVSEKLKRILDTTSGCIIYQEQVMQICRDIAGFSFGKADLIRRAMAKKKSSEMENERHAFIYGDKDEDGNVICCGAIANGISEKDAGKIFDTLSKFAKYAFNKAHAAAYSFISYRTAYLKAHYPCEFIASLLSSVLGNVSKTAIYISEAQKHSISVLPPNINESREKYSVVEHDGKNAIRFGLLGIKNVGISFIGEVINERRKNGIFVSFVNFVERIACSDINKRQVEALIKSGAFDELGIPRSMLLAEYEKVIDVFIGRKKNQTDGQLDMFSILSDENENSKDVTYEFNEIPEISLADKIKQEKESTGMYFSGHPIDEYLDGLKHLSVASISDIFMSFDENSSEKPYFEKQTVTIAGIITSRVNKRTRNGDPMAFIKVEDRYGEIELILFPKVLEENSYMLFVDKPIAAMGEISVSDDAPPKIIVKKVIPLSKFASARSEEKSTREKVGEGSVGAQKLYLKIDKLSGRTLDRIMDLLSIFPGNISIIFYESSSKKYIKASGIGVANVPSMIKLLKDILGEGNVVIK